MRDKEARSKIENLEKRLNNPLNRTNDWFLTWCSTEPDHRVSLEKELENLSKDIRNLTTSFHKFVCDTGFYLKQTNTSKYVKKPKRSKKCADD